MARRRKKKRKPNGKASWRNPVYIYVLKDGRHRFYVGRSVDPRSRLSSHISGCWKGRSAKDKRIRKILNKGRTPNMDILAKTRSEAKAKRLERYYVSKWGETNILLR